MQNNTLTGAAVVECLLAGSVLDGYVLNALSGLLAVCVGPMVSFGVEVDKEFLLLDIPPFRYGGPFVFYKKKM